MSGAVVVRVENLSKKYKLGTIGYGSLRHDFSAWWARMRGKEDPNSQIGEGKPKDLYGDFWALKGVSFELNEGDRLGIIGRNGAGKSTLLKILSQITRPTSGTIKLKGRVEVCWKLVRISSRTDGKRKRHVEWRIIGDEKTGDTEEVR